MQNILIDAYLGRDNIHILRHTVLILNEVRLGHFLAVKISIDLYLPLFCW